MRTSAVLETGRQVTDREVAAEPDAFRMVRLTANVPADAKAWLGFWEVLVAPSPKAQDQDVGFPVDVSVN